MKLNVKEFGMEPSSKTLGKAYDLASQNLSDEEMKVVLNSAGWSGYRISYKGKSYNLITKSRYSHNEGYSLYLASNEPFSYGRRLDMSFNDIEDCKEYLKSL